LVKRLELRGVCVQTTPIVGWPSFPRTLSS
jgi:hypothetical protein